MRPLVIVRPKAAQQGSPNRRNHEAAPNPFVMSGKRTIRDIDPRGAFHTLIPLWRAHLLSQSTR
jgi:hypothetical protein